MSAIWETRGIEVLEKCATEQPGTFLKVCASLMPQDVRLDVSVDATSFVMKFRQAVELLGNEPPALPRRMKVIDAR